MSNLEHLYNTQKQVTDEIDFIHADKHQSFLHTLFQHCGHQIFLQLDTIIIDGMIKHSQSTQINKFVISLQYLKKEVRNGVHFLHLDKHQSF